MTENFKNVEKDMDIQVQQAFSTLHRHELKRTYPCHIIFKIPEVRKDIESYMREMPSHL
jgi:hypothetical protein